MSGVKVIGRILSLGYSMPGIQVDNYNLLSAPSFFDYDALVVEPRAIARYLSDVIEGSAEGRTFSGGRLVSGAPGPGEVALDDILLRRRDETQRLLDNGGIVAMFAYPTERRTAGSQSIDPSSWLPLPASDGGGDALLSPAEGSQAHVVDWEHPLAAFVASQLANIAYRAEVAPRRVEGIRVFVRSVGGANIGVELPATRGRIFVLPALKAPPAGDKRYAASDELQAGIRRALGVTAQGRPPPWVHGIALPGLSERAQVLAEAREALTASQAAVDEAEGSHEALARFQRLLWQEGAVGLDGVVLEALRLIGFEVHDRDPRELEVKSAEGDALFEIEASEHPVEMAAHHRLRQRIERAIEKRGQAPRGVLFVNGQRLQAPTQRQHVSDPLRVAAETMRYCLAPTAGLYDAIVAKLAGDDDAVSAYRQALIATDGLLS